MANFRARARTVDLLGRQQIAGIPTAISELFKNAHDAYASRVEADFMRDWDVLAVRDDGVGMSGAEFAERWLVLGTESKVRGQASRPQPREGFLPRPVLGEKGIGRLAIASIGPALLVLTRPLVTSGEAPVNAAFLHWGIFEVPGINLDEIDVPVQPFADLPDANAVNGMVTAFARNLKNLFPSELEQIEREETGGPRNESEESDVMKLVRTIHRDLRSFDVDPPRLDATLPGPSLTRDGHGTHFYVKPTDESLTATLTSRERGRASDLQASLIGFADTMRPGSPAPAVRTAFRDHNESGVQDLLAAGEFFTPDEFASADHRIEGSFDEEGTFSGTVTIYGERSQPYTLPWARRGEISCGPFVLSLAVVQPEADSSKLSKPALVALRRKLDRLGGLYVYRDGIRILPYGRPENDWLEIEQERSKNLGRAYWSHRRMFGEVLLDGELNGSLEEKAGREGFRDNRAYRQFREVLMRFLRNVATDFFQTGGEHAEAFVHLKSELERKAKARSERERRAVELRAKFGRRLADVEQLIEDGVPQREVDRILTNLAKSLASSETPEDVLDAERDARLHLSAARGRTEVSRPQGFGLSSDLRAAWSAQQAALSRLDDHVFVPAAARIAREATSAAEQLSAPPDPAQRLVALITDTSLRAEDDLAQEEQGAREALEQTSEAVREFLVRAHDSFRETVDRVLAELNVVDGDLEQLRRDAEASILGDMQREREAIAAVAAQLRAVRAEHNGSGPVVSELEAIDAIEEELLTLRERNTAELELAQLGLGIQIVGHEFNASVGAVRAALRELKPWADANTGLQRPYRDLRVGFEHLEGYLRLLVPLQRRLNRRRSRIHGREIVEYLEQLFAARLQRDTVELIVTDAFAEHELVTFRSTIYPAFVALLDNALFWVGERRGPRWVRLDADEHGMLISNSGPAIPRRDRGRIFELGFSRKPGGQGTGLFVVQESLAAEGLEISVVDVADGWAFRIAPQEKQ